MRVGDKVVPFLQKWRIGLVGTDHRSKYQRRTMEPYVGRGEYTPNPTEAELVDEYKSFGKHLLCPAREDRASPNIRAPKRASRFAHR